MTPLFDPYVSAQSRFANRAQIWRLVVVMALAIAGQILATIVLFAAFALVASWITGRPFDQELAMISNLGSPQALVAALVTFAGTILAVWLAMPWLHKTSARWLLGVTGRMNWRHLALGFVAVIGIGVAAQVASLPFQDYVRHASWTLWLTWAGPVLVVTFLQVFAEELLFRGYLQSHLASRFRSPLIWIGVPALLFGAAHIANAAAFGANAWLVLLAPTLVGIVAADVTARTGSIGGAVGLHMANNVLGILLIAVPGPFGVVSLFHHPIDLADAASVRPLILINIGVILAGYVGWLLIMRGRAIGAR